MKSTVTCRLEAAGIGAWPKLTQRHHPLGPEAERLSGCLPARSTAKSLQGQPHQDGGSGEFRRRHHDAFQSAASRRAHLRPRAALSAAAAPPARRGSCRAGSKRARHLHETVRFCGGASQRRGPPWGRAAMALLCSAEGRPARARGRLGRASHAATATQPRQEGEATSSMLRC